MRTYKLLFLFLCIIHFSCNNDDDTTVNEEVDTSNLVLENRIVRNSDVDFLGEQLWEIDLVDGSDIEFDFNRTQMLIHNDILYLNYVANNPSLPLPFPTLLAIDATTGTAIWVENQTEYEFRHIAILNNRMITVETFNNETRITSQVLMKLLSCLGVIRSIVLMKIYLLTGHLKQTIQMYNEGLL